MTDERSVAFGRQYGRNHLTSSMPLDLVMGCILKEGLNLFFGKTFVGSLFVYVECECSLTGRVSTDARPVFRGVIRYHE